MKRVTQETLESRIKAIEKRRWARVEALCKRKESLEGLIRQIERPFYRRIDKLQARIRRMAQAADNQERYRKRVMGRKLPTTPSEFALWVQAHPKAFGRLTDRAYERDWHGIPKQPQVPGLVVFGAGDSQYEPRFKAYAAFNGSKVVGTLFVENGDRVSGASAWGKVRGKEIEFDKQQGWRSGDARPLGTWREALARRGVA